MSRMVHEISSPVEAGRRIELWIWTHLRDTDAHLRVEGREVAADPDALVEAPPARDRTE